MTDLLADEELPEEQYEELDELSTEFIDTLVKRLILFTEEFCDVKFFPYQVPIAYRIIESIVLGDGEELSLIATRQSGKSEVISNVIASMMVILPKLASVYPTWLGKFSKGFLCGVFAPVEEQADTIFGRVVSKLTSEHALDFLLDPEIDDKATSGGSRGKGKAIALKNSGSLCRMQTCNPKAKIESKTYHFVVVDEAQGADEVMITKCVAEGTEVWTPEGNALPVEQVVLEQLDIVSFDKPWDLREGIGKQVHGRDREIGNLVPTTPTEWHDNGIKPVWRVTTASGRYIEATANHRWIVRERKGNSLPKERRTDQLEVGMQLPLTLDGDPGSHGSGTLDEGYFSGQIIGDGCTAQQVQWCGHRDGAMSEMIRIAESWGDTFSIYNENHDNGLVEGAFIGGTCKSLLGHYQLLKKIGVNKCLSTSGHSGDFYRGLIAGLWDSDGYVDAGQEGRNGALYYSSVSETLVRQVQYVLQRLGILGTLSVRDNFNTSYASTNPLWTLCVKDVESIKQFHDIIQLHTEYKSSALATLRERADIRSGRRHPAVDHPRRSFGGGRIAWDRIVSIEYVGERRTFCVTVEPSNTVIWNGFVGLNSIKPMLAFNNGTIVISGTATREKCYFYKMIQYNRRRDVNGRRNHRQAHFEYDYRVASKYNTNYAKFIAKEKLRLGEDSDEFLMSYSNQWILEKGMFLTEERLNSLYDPSMSFVKQWWRTPIVVGIDVARSNDSTVVCAVWVDWDHPDGFGFYEHRVLNWLEINNVDWESQYFQIIDFIRNYDVLRVGVDSQGVGGAVAERLQILLPSIEVLAVTSDAKNQNERWVHLTELIQREQILFPGHSKARRTKSWKKFHQQMSDLEKTYRGPYMLAAAPNERGAFDDYADALAIACAMTKIDTMPTVQVLGNNPFYG